MGLILTQIYHIGSVSGLRILSQIDAVDKDSDVGNKNEMQFVKFSF